MKCLQTINESGKDVMVECLKCGRKVKLNPLDLYSRLPGKWLKTLDAQGKQLRCSVCGEKGPKLVPVER